MLRTVWISTGYALAAAAGIYVWQWSFVMGASIRMTTPDDHFLLQILLTWLAIPVGYLAVVAVAWPWFALDRSPDTRHTSRAITLGVLLMLASCGGFVAQGEKRYADPHFVYFISDRVMDRNWF